jgi:hypothetical protein
MLEVILQNGQRTVEENYRWSISVRGPAISWSTGVKNSFPDSGGAFDTVVWGGNAPNSSRELKPLYI